MYRTARNRTPRFAFTLVELLVVIAIIGILAALLLPAVNFAREAARRSTCTNQIRQLALAAASHETRKQRLPGFQEPLGARRVSWTVALLPDLEQQPLYDTWLQGSADTPFLEILRCPSQSVRTLTDKSDYCASLGFAPNGAPSPYDVGAVKGAPVAGALPAGYDYWDARRKENGAFVDRVVPTGWKVPNQMITVTSSDFRDGKSNTILFGENFAAGSWASVPAAANTWDLAGLQTGLVWVYANENNGYAEPPYFDANGSAIAAVDIATIPQAKINGFGLLSPGVIDRNPITSVQDVTHARPSSYHPGVAMVAFADGSTRALASTTNYYVYQSLMTLRNDRSDMPTHRYVLKADDLTQ